MKILKAILNEIKDFFSWYSFFGEAEKKRKEFYRKEITAAYNAGDYARAVRLQSEMYRGRWGL